MGNLAKRLDAIERKSGKFDKEPVSAIFLHLVGPIPGGGRGESILSHITVCASGRDTVGQSLFREDDETLQGFLERSAVEHRRVHGFLPDDWFEHEEECAQIGGTTTDGVIALDGPNRM